MNREQLLPIAIIALSLVLLASLGSQAYMESKYQKKLDNVVEQCNTLLQDKSRPDLANTDFNITNLPLLSYPST